MVNPDTAGSRATAVHEQALSGGQIVARIVSIICIAEILIMLAAGSLPAGTSPVTVAFLDALILAVIAIGPIFFWVIRPLARAHEEASKHIGYLAYHDPLTDLPNRRMLFEHLERALAACERHREYGAVMLLDLDGFKQINDDHGHDMGDYFLRQVAASLRGGERKEDIVARLGGDEFVVLAQQLGSSMDQAEARVRTIAAKLQHAVVQPVEYEGETLKAGCSIGVRLMGPRRISAARAIRDADIAMYGAKKDPDSAVHVFRETTPVVLEDVDGADASKAKAG